MSHFPNLRHFQEQRQLCRRKANEINDSKSKTASTAKWFLRECAIDHPIRLVGFCYTTRLGIKLNDYTRRVAGRQRRGELGRAGHNRTSFGANGV